MLVCQTLQEAVEAVRLPTEETMAENEIELWWHIPGWHRDLNSIARAPLVNPEIHVRCGRETRQLVIGPGDEPSFCTVLVDLSQAEKVELWERAGK